VTEPTFSVPTMEGFLARYAKDGATVREGWLYAVIRSPRGRWVVLYVRNTREGEDFFESLPEWQDEAGVIGRATDTLKGSFTRHHFPELSLLVFRFHTRQDTLDFEKRARASLGAVREGGDFGRSVELRLETLADAREKAEAAAIEKAHKAKIPFRSEFFDYGEAL
jgi:hypothetical protein